MAEQIPVSYRENLREAHHTPEMYSPELKALLDPNIVARRTSLPLSGQVEIVNREYVYYWARRIKGKSADHDNYSKLRFGGYQNATCDPKCEQKDGNCKCDVHPLISEVTADGTEITLGSDLILVKARPDVHYGRMKSYLQRSINMTNPEKAMGALPGDDQAAMNMTRTRAASVEDQERISSRAQDKFQRGTPQWDEIAKGKKETK